MKTKGRRVSANLIDARNLTGKNYARTQGQLQEAFDPKGKRDFQKNHNKTQNQLTTKTTGPMGDVGKQILDRRRKLLTNPRVIGKKGK